MSGLKNMEIDHSWSPSKGLLLPKLSQSPPKELPKSIDGGSAPSDRVKTETTFSFVALLRNAAGWIVWLLVVCAVLNCLLRVLGASATSSGDQDSRRSRKKSTKSRKEKETEAETPAAAVSTADSDEPE